MAVERASAIHACRCWFALAGLACPDSKCTSLTRHATQARELQAARAQLALKQSLVAEKDTIIASLQQRTGQVLPACKLAQVICLRFNPSMPLWGLDADLPGGSTWPPCCMTLYLALMRWASSNIIVTFKASGSVHVDANEHIPSGQLEAHGTTCCFMGVRISGIGMQGLPLLGNMTHATQACGVQRQAICGERTRC